ncbi:PTS mannitol-specific transporter subunit IIBC [Streptococcus macacae]|uniref:PTS system mannitol-specific EIICB component n=1 Tax=Streptococcus macacae NCTC 11558 TaxID=764298 RepID=G5JVJ0_9STRE|nr:PTS mannitol-specific transporter subunit IIBC [Streptococcus macacae]EHJ51873.1 EIICBA-Mtl [Streptococcus macacae NCTC 11558]SUN78584.1 PTS system, mannitol-specific enzyme IIBC component [Streptococcus macacae NCTC 11558]
MAKRTSLKVRVQQLGTSLSNMVMPNIAAIIAWGFITALFMKGGWFPNPKIAELIQPTLHYLLPILIAYCGGKMVYQERGAVVGAIAVMGVIVGADIPMFLGAMIMGPLGGWCMKKFDQVFQEKVRSGFEMIYNNFSAGIIGIILAVLGTYIVNPLVVGGSNIMAAGVDWIISVHLLPLANIFIEPAKVLFLNNAIGNGILVPIGVQQAASAGKSVLFLLESNPGPGLGILLAYMFFGKGSAKSSAPGAAIIHFFGGIHEIYFPYILMKPALILAAIAGGVSGTFTFQILGGGLKAAASPGSIIAISLMTAKGAYFGTFIGVAMAALVSFLVAALILKSDKSMEDDSLEAAQAANQAAKAESKGQQAVDDGLGDSDITVDNIHQIIFACDAGMGSSAMGASILRDKVKKANLEIPVTNQAIANLQDTTNTLIITQEELADRALQKTPRAVHVTVDNFLATSKYDDIVVQLASNEQSSDIKEPEPMEMSDNSSTAIDLNHIDAVAFAHGTARGSATMGQETLRAIFRQNNIRIPVSTVFYQDLDQFNAKNILVVTTIAQQSEVQQAAPNAQLLVVDSLVTSPEYDRLVSRLHK